MSSNNQAVLIESFYIPKLDKAIRLSDLSFENFRSLNSRKAVKKAVKQGLIIVNGKRGYTADFMVGGEKLDVFQNENEKPRVNIDLTIEVLFEDDFLAIVNKPPGIVVSGNKKWTLEHALTTNLKRSTQLDAAFPEPIHRLDYPTSGALLIGKTRSIIRDLNTLFEERKIQKTYHAICINKMEKKGLIEFEVDEKASKSEFEVLETVVSPKYYFLNLVKIIPHTGRRHQLRKHLSAIGNPILGDLSYGKEGQILKGKGLYLHASSLAFVHPISKELIIGNAVFPKKFKKIFS